MHDEHIDFYLLTSSSAMRRQKAAAGSSLPISEQQHIIKEAVDLRRRL